MFVTPPPPPVVVVAAAVLVKETIHLGGSVGFMGVSHCGHGCGCRMEESEGGAVNIYTRGNRWTYGSVGG